jgi:hypothetical protein
VVSVSGCVDSFTRLSLVDGDLGKHGRACRWTTGLLLFKCAGLAGAQLAERVIPPSALSLLGLIRHATEVERTWFRQRFGGQTVDGLYQHAHRPTAAFHDVDPDRAEQDITALIVE